MRDQADMQRLGEHKFPGLQPAEAVLLVPEGQNHFSSLLEKAWLLGSIFACHHLTESNWKQHLSFLFYVYLLTHTLLAWVLFGRYSPHAVLSWAGPCREKGAFCGEDKQTWFVSQRVYPAGGPGHFARMSGGVGRIALLSSQQGLAADQVRARPSCRPGQDSTDTLLP